MRQFRIYGDNILECEEALRLLAEAFNGTYIFTDSNLYAPLYILSVNENDFARIQLCPGYGRWIFDIQMEFRNRGSVLREMLDAVISEIKTEGNTLREIPLIAFEFSGALPAGNNAWQRCGRAISSAQAKVPYLYFAELGGIELDQLRNPIAPRFPNAVVPFAYYALGRSYNSLTIPIYRSSPSITASVFQAFGPYLAGPEIYTLIKAIINGSEDQHLINQLEQKALMVTATLASRAVRSNQALSASEWDTVGKLPTAEDRVIWFIKRGMRWRKKISISRTFTLDALLEKVQQLGACAVGSTDLPFCILPGQKREELGDFLEQLYGEKVSENFISWLKSSNLSLALVWIAGFKPRGDDSRPDRGLVPLVRMTLGKEVDVLSVIYGPGSKDTWELFERDPSELVTKNGFWEAVLSLSTGILVDNPNAQFLRSYGVRVELPSTENLFPNNLVQPAPLEPTYLGEHEVDSVLHIVFSVLGDEIFFEGLCNPPGGNWSGFSIFDRTLKQEIRWVSLPRVSGSDMKRPDHVFQFSQSSSDDILLIVESKDRARNIEKDIGPRLRKYIESLLVYQPNISREQKLTWSPTLEGYKVPLMGYFTAAAFKLSTIDELESIFEKSNVDIVFGIEFLQNRVGLHVFGRVIPQWLLDALNIGVAKFKTRLVVKIYSLTNSI